MNLLKAACEQAGWEMTIRPDGRAQVVLDVPGVPRKADILEEDVPVRCVADLCSLEGLSEVSRRALSQLLARLNSNIQLVRGGFTRAADREFAFFETVLPTPHEAETFVEGLAALSVAFRLCGEEALLLADEAVAETYLHATRDFLANKNNETINPKDQPICV